MSDYFPQELIEKILLKLPAKSLIKFTIVCKSWRSIITSPSFISSYLYKPKNETLLLRRYDKKQEQYSLLEVSTDNKSFFSIIDSSSELEVPLTGTLFFQGYCRGVICLAKDILRCKPTIILCNPCIKKHFILPKATRYSEFRRYCALGFGVAADDDDFKVVMLVYCGGFLRLDTRVHTEPEAKVFSLREGSWRRLGIHDVRLRNLCHVRSHVFLNGVMHWIGYKYSPVTEVEDVSIVLFHVAQEVFDEIKLPKGLPIGIDYRLTMTLTSIGESLALIGIGEESSCEVWLMKEYGDEGSWTRLYSVKLVQGMDRPLTLRKSGEALMISHRNELVAFDFENLEAKKLGIRGVRNTNRVEDYVESLELLTGESGDLQEWSEDEEEDLM